MKFKMIHQPLSVSQVTDMTERHVTNSKTLATPTSRVDFFSYSIDISKLVTQYGPLPIFGGNPYKNLWEGCCKSSK